MDDGPGFVARLADRLAVLRHGGVRIRVLEGGGAIALGRTLGPPPDRIRREVLELRPEGPGTLDLVHDGAGRWWIRGGGALDDARLLQRLRNVLGSCR